MTQVISDPGDATKILGEVGPKNLGEKIGLSLSSLNQLEQRRFGFHNLESGNQLTMGLIEGLTTRESELIQLHESGMDQAALLGSAINLYALIDTYVDRGELSVGHANLIRGLATYDFQEGEAGLLIQEIMYNNARKHLAGMMHAPLWFRADEVGFPETLERPTSRELGILAETQVPEGGAPFMIISSSLAEPAVIGANGVAEDCFLEALNTRASEGLIGSHRHIAFHVGNGLINYGTSFAELAVYLKSHYPEVDFSLIIGPNQIAKDASLQGREVIELMSSLFPQAGINFILDDNNLQSSLGNNIPDVIYRLSDSARLNTNTSLPLLRLLASGRTQMESPLFPLVDRSHIIQALLHLPELEFHWNRSLGQETFHRLKRRFPAQRLVGAGGASDLNLETYSGVVNGGAEATGTVTASMIRDQAILRVLASSDKKLSGGAAVNKISSTGVLKAVMAESVEAVQELMACGRTNKTIVSLVSYERHTVPGLRSVKHAGGGVLQSETFNARVRGNTWYLNRPGGDRNNILIAGRQISADGQHTMKVGGGKHVGLVQLSRTH